MSPIPRPLGLRTFGRLSLLLLACAALYLYAAHNAGRKELRALCEQGVEPKVYRKVSADGYFDGGISCLRNGCWDVLMKSGFRYIEVEQRDGDPWDPLPENGFYRLSKVRQDSGLCDPKILAEMQKAVGYREMVSGGDCIRLEMIESPTARYGLFSEMLDSMPVANWFNSRIEGQRFVISDMELRSIVAEQTNYMLFQNSLPSFSSFNNMLHCYSRGIGERSHADVTRIEVYLNPK